jgi:general secretion pathway protein L
MSMQLVLSVTNSQDGKTLGDLFRWCWLGADGSLSEAPASGGREDLRAALGSNPPGGTQSTWLILPGSTVAIRALEYTEKEKKHLRNLMPYQLEDAVIGDVEDLHFSFSTPVNGQVTLAYAEKSWLQAVFAELATLGLEINRCWSAPLTLPLVASEPGSEAGDWTLAWYQDQVWLRYDRYQGFAVAPSQAAMALQLLLQGREQLPHVHLRAASKEDLQQLHSLVPSMLKGQVLDAELADDWALDFSGSSIDLCQGEFSRRLPIERWWKLWKSAAIFAGICVVVYLASSLYEIHRLGKDNLAIRQQIESTARQVITQGRMQDAEKQLTILLRQMEPTQKSGSVMELLAIALPAIGELPSVQVKGIAYTSETGELNINIQADSFSTFETLSDNIKARGLGAELLSANAQGNVQTARLKVSKP